MTDPKKAYGAKKPQLGLLPPSAIVLASKVMELGAHKYGPYNWRDTWVDETVYIQAALRHLLAAADGQDTDPESGQPHYAHVMACMAILIDAKTTGNLTDDRYKSGKVAELIEVNTCTG